MAAAAATVEAVDLLAATELDLRTADEVVVRVEGMVAVGLKVEGDRDRDRVEEMEAEVA